MTMKAKERKIRLYLTRAGAEAALPEAAYCLALEKAGLMNLNLIRLSSVLPHGAEVVEERPVFTDADYGKRLYVIISEVRTQKRGARICAGLGWMRARGGDGNGLVVEAQGACRKEVSARIERALAEIAGVCRRPYDKVRIVTQEARNGQGAACALVALVFTLEGWT